MADSFKNYGAKYSKIKKGNYIGATIVNAWNFQKGRGMLTCTVSPYRNSKVVKSNNGNRFQSMIAIVDYENSGVQKKIPCLMNLENKKIVLEEINMVISPNGSGKTSKGSKTQGYFGKLK